MIKEVYNIYIEDEAYEGLSQNEALELLERFKASLSYDGVKYNVKVTHENDEYNIFITIK